LQIDRQVLGILMEVLSLDRHAASMNRDSPLLGAIPELDSMAVLQVLTTIEERFGVTIEDDELDASNFATVGTLADFVSSKVTV
jgi:acyl carrier protein